MKKSGLLKRHKRFEQDESSIFKNLVNLSWSDVKIVEKIKYINFFEVYT